MAGSNRHLIFSEIHTIGKLPDGRIIDRVISYPLGADYKEYMRLEDSMCLAFGSLNCRTVGTPFQPRYRLA